MDFSQLYKRMSEHLHPDTPAWFVHFMETSLNGLTDELENRLDGLTGKLDKMIDKLDHITSKVLDIHSDVQEIKAPLLLEDLPNREDEILKMVQGLKGFVSCVFSKECAHVKIDGETNLFHAVQSIPAEYLGARMLFTLS